MLFVDGSYLKTETGGHRTGYTITNLSSPLEYRPPPEVQSAQTAKLIELTRACQLAKDQTVNVH